METETLIRSVAQALKISQQQVGNTLKLLDEGCTVPFIARYRKEMTHGLDEEQILFIQQQIQYLSNLEKRKEDVLRLIETQGKLTSQIRNQVMACEKLSQVEDIYRPYQQKRKTRATEAAAKGLTPLAEWILSRPERGNIEKEAATYLNDEIKTVEEALQGAKDIIAEKVSDDASLRWKIKAEIEKNGILCCKQKKNSQDEDQVYKMYYDYSESLKTVANHRIMAIDRAEKEKVLSVTLQYDQDSLIRYAAEDILNKRKTVTESLIIEAVNDGLKRLAFPSVEREVRNEMSDRAHKQSIEIFSMNVERLLLQPPLEGKMILGLDPGFRTGCKLAVIDSTGKMLDIDVFYPHPPVNRKKEARQTLLRLLKQYPIEVIAIGNGTASRESESFVAQVIREENLNVDYTLVSEAGASVYSASELARKEFPDLHVEQRSAVSIARRLLDPLSELIKIDPKSIGVGQYQHDLPVKALNERLDFAILKSVNRVGVDVNTASEELLCHVSGLTKASAAQLIKYRDENGRFDNRKQLLKVPKLGAKSFQQAAGFLRIHDGSEPLDQTPIHPESYPAAKKLITSCHITELGNDDCREKLAGLSLKETAQQLNIDEYTLKDIIDALAQPLRDYREQFDGPMLRHDVLTLNDLHPGDELEGVVRNVVDFGAFVDIGLHEDGLVHISKMNKIRKCKHPSELVSIGDILKVWVLDVDEKRHRVSLSMIKPTLEMISEAKDRR